MSKKRKKAGDEQNKFRMLMNHIHADESELPDFDEDFDEDDRGAVSIESEVIDIEARLVIDPSALPFAKPKVLPAAPGIQVGSETSAQTETEPQTSPDPKPTKGPGRPRKLNAKPKNTNNGQRGRPATGKRSNNEWQGRTFYVRKQTDDVLTSALFKLKRSGIALDKSDLVDALLEAWAEVTLGDISDFQIGEIVENRLKKP